MKVFQLLTGGGALVIMTSHSSIEDARLLLRLAAKGIDKFIAREIPLELAKERYGGHFDVIRNDLHETRARLPTVPFRGAGARIQAGAAGNELTRPGFQARGRRRRAFSPGVSLLSRCLQRGGMRPSGPAASSAARDHND
jgi:hypothetical protein